MTTEAQGEELTVQCTDSWRSTVGSCQQDLHVKSRWTSGQNACRMAEKADVKYNDAWFEEHFMQKSYGVPRIVREVVL
jgi:hypothetical protein